MNCPKCKGLMWFLRLLQRNPHFIGIPVVFVLFGILAIIGGICGLRNPTAGIEHKNPYLSDYEWLYATQGLDNCMVIGGIGCILVGLFVFALIVENEYLPFRKKSVQPLPEDISKEL